MNLRNNEYIVAVITKILTVAIGIAYSAFTARYLGPGLKGETTYIISITNISSIILTLGIHQAYAYYRKVENNEELKHLFVNNYAIIILLFTLISIFISIYYDISATNQLLLFLTPIFAFSRVISYIYLIENSRKRNIYVCIFTLIRLLYVLALFMFTTSNIYFAISIILLFDVLISVIYSIKLHINFTYKLISLKFIKKICCYGIIPMLTLLMSTFNYKVDIIMLNYNNISNIEIGLYSIGLMLAEEILIVPEAIKEVLLSKLAKGSKEEEVSKVIRLCTPLCLIFFIIMYFFGKFIIYILYGELYINSYTVTIITMFGVMFIMFYKMIATYNIVNNLQKFNIIVLGFSVVINTIVNSFLIPLYGILGAAISTDVAYILCGLVFIIFFSRTSKLSIKSIIIMNRHDIQTIHDLFNRRKYDKS